MTDMNKTYNGLPVHPGKEGIPAQCPGCGVSAVRYGYVMVEQEDDGSPRPAAPRPSPAARTAA